MQHFANVVTNQIYCCTIAQCVFVNKVSSVRVVVVVLLVFPGLSMLPSAMCPDPCRDHTQCEAYREREAIHRHAFESPPMRMQARGNAHCYPQARIPSPVEQTHNPTSCILHRHHELCPLYACYTDALLSIQHNETGSHYTTVSITSPSSFSNHPGSSVTTKETLSEFSEAKQKTKDDACGWLR